MDSQNLLVSQSESVATITINRPQARNALDSLTIAELRQAFSSCASDASVRVVLMRGAGAVAQKRIASRRSFAERFDPSAS